MLAIVLVRMEGCVRGVHSPFQAALLWFWGCAKLCSAPEFLSRWAISWWFQWFSAETAMVFQLLSASNSLQCIRTGTQTASCNSPTNFWVILALPPYVFFIPMSGTPEEKRRKLSYLSSLSACKVSLGLFTELYKIPTKVSGTLSAF